jgi:hypothetical protein
MFRRVALLLVVTASAAAQSPPWVPYDEGVERQRQVTGEAAASMDHLVPFDRYGFKLLDCVAGYAAAPSFAPPEGWCLTSEKGEYLLESWKGEPPVHGKRVPIDNDLAGLIQDIWVNALLDTHYPRADSTGTDGTSDFFHVRTRGLYLQGQTWSPSGDRPPAWLVSAASDVMTFVRAEHPNADRLRMTLTNCKERLFSYYKRRRNGGA